MVTVVQGKVCAKNHPDRLSRLATIHQRYRRTDGRISYGIGLDLTVGQKCLHLASFDRHLNARHGMEWSFQISQGQTWQLKVIFYVRIQYYKLYSGYAVNAKLCATVPPHMLSANVCVPLERFILTKQQHKLPQLIWNQIFLITTHWYVALTVLPYWVL